MDLSPVIVTFLFRRTEEASVDQATAIVPTFPRFVRSPLPAPRSRVTHNRQAGVMDSASLQGMRECAGDGVLEPARPSQPVIRLSRTPRLFRSTWPGARTGAVRPQTRA
jgi:hypothetical protein